MDEDFQKRNTDCVYFLASPLTCKKGIDCEYRHNETARLNPRDCWYWVSGGCFNPTCAFRHPPLDGRPDIASESASSHHQSAAPANKTNVPCYFYFNGFCSKGERCFYLHGPDETMHAWKSSKTVSAAVDGAYLEKKISTNSDLGHVPVETQPFEIVPNKATRVKIKPDLELFQLPSNNVAEKSSLQISASPCKEVAAIRTRSPILEEAFVQSRSQESTGQSSDDEQLDRIEREDWLESSSSGFDVLVNDGSEDFVYEDDAAYLLHHNVEDQEQYSQLSGYDFEDNVAYDPAYPDLRISVGREVHDDFRYVDDEDIQNPITELPFCEKERVLGCTLQQKRTFFQEELGSKSRSGVDLRDILKKRRVINGQYPNYSQIRERPCMVSRRHLNGRLESKIEVCSVGSRIGNKTHLDGIHKPARYRHSHLGRSRHNFKERRPAKRQNLLSKISGKITSRKQKRSTEGSDVFTGPKTLAQIKEEKRKTQENGDCSAP